jgi:hypothetical protein
LLRKPDHPGIRCLERFHLSQSGFRNRGNAYHRGLESIAGIIPKQLVHRRMVAADERDLQQNNIADGLIKSLRLRFFYNRLGLVVSARA